MAHSIELLLDDRSDAAVRAEWQRLDDAGAAQPAAGQVGHQPPAHHPAGGRSHRRGRRRRTDAVAGTLPASGRPRRAADLRRRGKLTLARLVVASADLLDLHREVVDRCLPSPAAGTLRPQRAGTLDAARHPRAAVHPGAGGPGARRASTGLSADIDAQVVGLRRWDGEVKRIPDRLTPAVGCTGLTSGDSAGAQSAARRSRRSAAADRTRTGATGSAVSTDCSSGSSAPAASHCSRDCSSAVAPST